MPKGKAKKRGVRSSRRQVKKSSGRSVSSSSAKTVQKSRGLRIAFMNLILFAIIFVVSLILYLTISDLVLNEFFNMMVILTGSIAVAFLIVTLIFLFMRVLRRR